MKHTLFKFWATNKGIITGIFLLLFFRSAVADWYHVPTGSMQPNILIGDRVWVNKLAYDVKVPFSQLNLSRHAEPSAGEIVVFESESAGKRLIKRVIATPGDSVAMVNGQLFINQQPLQLERLSKKQTFDTFLNDRAIAAYFLEGRSQNPNKNSNLQPISYPVRYSVGIQSQRYFGERTVPEDHYWVMGDNRDNSADSRVIDFVPRTELIGRAERIVISLDRNNFYFPRRNRFWHSL